MLQQFAWILQTALLTWLGALMLFVVFKLFTGGIVLNGLLTHDLATGQGAAERTFLLAATLGFAFYYASNTLSTFDPANPVLPDVPEGILTALFGVNGVYLTGKIFDLRKKGFQI